MTYADKNPKIGIIMGSQSDWNTMREAHEILHGFGIAMKSKSSLLTAHPTVWQTTRNQPNPAACTSS